MTTRRHRSARSGWSRALFVVASVSMTALLASAQHSDPVAEAVLRHGGSQLYAVLRLRMEGQSVTGTAAPEPVRIAAALEAGDTGSLRLDYGQPVRRSYVNASNGAGQILDGHPAAKRGHVGTYAQLDMLSALGILHLAKPGVQRSLPQPSVVAGRPSAKVHTVTGRSKTFYLRPVTDEAEVQVDAETGLVAQILRRHYAEKSLDVSFLAGFRFSDYRTVEGLLLPFRIERIMDGAVREVLSLNTITINPALEPDLFAVPRAPLTRRAQ